MRVTALQGILLYLSGTSQRSLWLGKAIHIRTLGIVVIVIVRTSMCTPNLSFQVQILLDVNLLSLLELYLCIIALFDFFSNLSWNIRRQLVHRIPLTSPDKLPALKMRKGGELGGNQWETWRHFCFNLVLLLPTTGIIPLSKKLFEACNQFLASSWERDLGPWKCSFWVWTNFLKFLEFRSEFRTEKSPNSYI